MSSSAHSRVGVQVRGRCGHPDPRQQLELRDPVLSVGPSSRRGRSSRIACILPGAVAWPWTGSTSAACADRLQRGRLRGRLAAVHHLREDGAPVQNGSSGPTWKNLSSSSTSSSSSDHNIKKKRSKIKKERSPSISSSQHRMICVKTTDMKLGSWPTTLQFAGWRLRRTCVFFEIKSNT